MAKLFISRLLETFFRRKWLFLLPIVPFLALGVLNVATKEPSYRSTGKLLINEPLVGQPNAGGTSQFGGDTPGVYTAEQINRYLGFDAFLQLLIEKGDLQQDIDNGTITPAEIRRSVWAIAEGDDVVLVNAATWDPTLAYQLAQGTIDTFHDWLATNAEKNSRDALVIYEKELEGRRATAEAAAGTGAEASAAAEAAVAETLGKIDAAEESLENSRSLVVQQNDPRDPPELGAPESSRKQDLITLVMYLVLGGLVSTAALVVATLMDRSVRYSEEIETRLDVPVVATIPDSTSAFTPRVL